MNTPTKNKNRKIQYVANFIGVFALVFLIYCVWQAYNISYKNSYSIRQSQLGEIANTKLTSLNEEAVKVFELQQTTKNNLVNQSSVSAKLMQLDSFASQDNFELTILLTDLYAPELTTANAKLQEIAATQKASEKPAVAVVTPAPAAKAATVPILLYHKPPANLNAQLDALVAKGYTTITMAELASFFNGKGTLPKKPVVITFDDGFSEQLDTIAPLKAHHMKATYYLIIGGDKSNWCIGILRHNKTCGDNYMDWADVHKLVDSGVAEIGAHTIDHPNLAGMSVADQQKQIVESKNALEKELGIPITTFAYPYGRYNASTITIVRQAGFGTAVTTVGGVQQSLQNRYTLLRERNALVLP